jgi:hypothetical protein
LINTLALPFLVDKSISLSTRRSYPSLGRMFLSTPFQGSRDFGVAPRGVRARAAIRAASRALNSPSPQSTVLCEVHLFGTHPHQHLIGPIFRTHTLSWTSTSQRQLRLRHGPCCSSTSCAFAMVDQRLRRRAWANVTRVSFRQDCQPSLLCGVFRGEKVCHFFEIRCQAVRPKTVLAALKV